MDDTNNQILSNENMQNEIEGDISNVNAALDRIFNSKEVKDEYSKLQDSEIEAAVYFEDDVIQNVDALTLKIQTWDIETVKSVPADELEQTFLSLYDNLYILIQDVNPFWQVGMERLKLLKDYQDLYVEMLKVRGEL